MTPARPRAGAGTLFLSFALGCGHGIHKAPADMRGAPVDAGGAPSLWVTAYFSGAAQGSLLATADIDFSALTHLVHFSLRPNADGSLSDAAIPPPLADEVVIAAHAAGKKVLVCVGGAGRGQAGLAFAAAIAAAVRPTTIANLVALISERGYDGLDVDFEPLDPAALGVPSLLEDYAGFITDLRAALPPTALLTATPGAGLTTSHPSLFASLASSLDQINVHTYNLASFATGETWHNSALLSAGHTSLDGHEPLPSCDGVLTAWQAAGVPAGKLGLGIDFYGKRWLGANRPEQPLAVNAPWPIAVSYAQVMDTQFNIFSYHFEDDTGAAYLGLNNQFVSYEDELSSPRKVAYVRARGLGGLFIWELAGGYRASQPVGARDGLLQSIKQAVAAAP